jgi:hypothetical protein
MADGDPGAVRRDRSSSIFPDHGAHDEDVGSTAARRQTASGLIALAIECSERGGKRDRKQAVLFWKKEPKNFCL